MKAINLAILLFVIGNICHAFEIDGNPIQTILNINKDIGMVANNFDKGSYYDRWDQNVLNDPFATRAKTRVGNAEYSIYILHEHFIEISTSINDQNKDFYEHIYIGFLIINPNTTDERGNQSVVRLSENVLIRVIHEDGFTYITYRMNII